MLHTQNQQTYSQLAPWRIVVGGLLFGVATVLITLAVVEMGEKLHLPVAQAHNPSTSVYTTRSQHELKAAVDSLAIALSGILHTQHNKKTRKEIIKSALDPLTLYSNEQVYYMVWEGTEVVHSPFLPDLSGEDFHMASDAYSNPIAKQLEGQSVTGGFVKIEHPQGMNKEDGATEYWAYARAIPSTNWHIAALSLIDRELYISSLHTQKRQLLQAGFLYSGFSLVGLGSLVFACTPYRRRSHPHLHKKTNEICR